MSVTTPDQIIRTLSRRWKSTKRLTKLLRIDSAALRRKLKKMEEEELVESRKRGGQLEWRLVKGEAKRIRQIRKEPKAFKEEQKSSEQIRSDMKGVGQTLYRTLSKGQFPEIELPSRSTGNIRFDQELGQYVLAGKTVTRSTKNVGQIRSFSQFVWVMRFLKELLTEGKSSTLRDIYYQSFGFGVKFGQQSESDTTITDVEAKLKTPRESFRVFPEERAAIYGDLTIEYTSPPKYAGKQVNLTDHPDGLMIGPYLTSAKFIECKAKKVIAIESGGMFTRFVEDGVHETHDALLIHTAGQAPRSVRRTIRRLRYELNLPTYLFVDADPWGAHIAMVIISGSASAAHLRGLATPDAIWMGVWASDIEKYKLPSDTFTDTDKKRTQDLLKDPRYQTKFWQKELQIFLKNQRKAEQQAFSRYGLSFVTEEYLPNKFKEINKLQRQGLL
ncbi:MAG: DNA topoisomerase IV subunit A [Candidatus Hermodarchaeia archaeon]|jgi:DNA topoisomerase-6 subunit A